MYLWEDDFYDYLNSDRGYTNNTSKDYVGRVRRVCKLEGISINTLIDEIDDYIYKYKEGSNKKLNEEKHGAPSSALCRFKEYLDSLKSTKKNKTVVNKSIGDINDEENDELMSETFEGILKAFNNCYYIMFYKDNIGRYVHETWHIGDHDPLKCLKLSYDLAKKFESETGKETYILFGDCKTKVDQKYIELALRLYPNYTFEDYYNE